MKGSHFSINTLTKTNFVQDFHATPTGGHAGIAKTFSCLSDTVFWEGMHKDVVEFVSSCITCQKTKYITVRL